jgi:quinol monooxygenase YgiN
MYARTTTMNGDAAAMDDGIEYARDAVWPMLQNMSGCVGMSLLVDREAGRFIITSAWASDEAMQASAGSVRDSRSKAAEIMRADTVDIEEWEIAVMHRMHSADPGACTRMVRADCEPARMDAMVDSFRTMLIPRMEGADGFCSVSLMTDRNSGHVTWTVTFDSRDAVVGSRDRSLASRDAFSAETGIRITEVAEMDLAMAHLRVPELV